MYQTSWQKTTYRFSSMKELMAKASPPRSGDVLAGIAADSAEENIAAKLALADLPLKKFLSDAIIPYEKDDVTRLIIDEHDAAAFAPIASMTVGEFREWLLSETVGTAELNRVAPGNDDHRHGHQGQCHPADQRRGSGQVHHLNEHRKAQ